MIEQYTLMMLCEKYNINFNKLTNKNNNILDKGLYIEIDKTLNFLINELEISSENIQKCPSILYRNVDAIKKNILFLKGCDIHFSNVESCLHVLSSEPVELEDTYEYVKNNYGVEAINKNTSILSVKKGAIKKVEKLQLRFEKNGNLTLAVSINFRTTNIEEIQKIIQSEEFKNYPELFTSTVLAHAKLSEIRDIIQSEEFKNHPELFTSTVLAQTKLSEIKDIIQSKEFKNHPELFTSQTIAHAKLSEIKDIIQSEEFKKYPELFTSTVLAHAKLSEIRDIIQSEEFKNHPELFTSQTLARAKLSEIKGIIQSEEFKNHPELFTSQTLAHAKLSEIKGIIQSDEFKKYPELFTSEVLAYAKLSEIKDIIQSEEFKNHPELFTSQTLAHAKLSEIKAIIQSEEFKKYPELFTSTVLSRAKLSKIKDIIQSEEFKNHPELFTSSIIAKSKSVIKKLPVLFDLAKQYNIEEYINTSFLLFSPSRNYALINYLIDNKISLVIDGKLNPVFSKQPGVLKAKYNINIKELMHAYPFENYKVEKKK